MVRGKQAEAAAILKGAPELLSMKGDVTDYSGRTFHNVSPWECMHWALDTRYMGQMMLDSIPRDEAGDTIRRGLIAQYDIMKGGENDLLKLGGEVDPTTMDMATLIANFDNPVELRFMNKNAMLYWNENIYYVDKECQFIQLVTLPVFNEEDQSAFNKLRYVFETMLLNTSKKSTDKEHDAIQKTMGHNLDRKGLHYEQPAACKMVVRLIPET